jgi:hypothetical protein
MFAVVVVVVVGGGLCFVYILLFGGSLDEVAAMRRWRVGVICCGFDASGAAPVGTGWAHLATMTPLLQRGLL